jgi:hypothetical protein
MNHQAHTEVVLSVLTGNYNSLALAEMRLILARLVFEFDTRLTGEGRDWLRDCKTYTV